MLPEGNCTVSPEKCSYEPDFSAIEVGFLQTIESREQDGFVLASEKRVSAAMTVNL